MKNLQKKIVISIIVAAIVYLAFSIYVDFDKLLYAFSIFNWLWFPFLLLLSFLNYYLRFERWNYYLKILQLNLSRKVSFTIFIAGLVMSITPGKM
ncbi:MAG: lysylphosphatidylglycerol synthase domain-containing protein, partial [Ignavibacteria bacterium]|nr:lysylphosphatidylglycerol synthase domain-containing protein [Ignavibacteria bacterium]